MNNSASVKIFYPDQYDDVILSNIEVNVMWCVGSQQCVIVFARVKRFVIVSRTQNLSENFHAIRINRVKKYFHRTHIFTSRNFVKTYSKDCQVPLKFSIG